MGLLHNYIIFAQVPHGFLFKRIHGGVTKCCMQTKLLTSSNYPWLPKLRAGYIGTLTLPKHPLIGDYGEFIQEEFAGTERAEIETAHEYEDIFADFEQKAQEQMLKLSYKPEDLVKVI